jgi:hypothetical protein
MIREEEFSTGTVFAADALDSRLTHALCGYHLSLNVTVNLSPNYSVHPLFSVIGLQCANLIASREEDDTNAVVCAALATSDDR